MSSVVPVASPAHWTGERIRLRTWLDGKHKALAEFYSAAVEILKGPAAVPGKVYLVSHAVREIRNRLPQAVTGYSSDGRLQYPERVDELAGMWRESGASNGQAAQVGASGAVPLSGEATIPRTLHSRLDTLFVDHRKVYEKREGAARRLFLALFPDSPPGSLEPQISQWLDITEWFVDRTHFTGRTDADNDLVEFAARFDVFEAVLVTFVSEFFEVNRGINDILAEANRRTG